MRFIFPFQDLKVRRGAVLLAALLLLVAGVSRAASPSATASISSNQARVGDGLELEVKIEGGENVSPAVVNVNGLDIHYVGQSSQFSWTNGKSSRSIQYTYLVTPKKEGTYTIPALTFDVGGRQISTEPIQLSVTGKSGNPNPNALNGSGNTGGSSAPAPDSRAETKAAIAQWVLPKTSVYVGEAIPAELWLYVDKQVRCELRNVSAKSDGFSITLQKMDRLQQRDVEKDGREMVLAVIKLAITPVKAGKLTLDPAEINAIAILPQKRSRARLPGGFDSIFNDPFFNQALNVPQEVVIRPDAVELEVKPLPAAGKPADFSGAIGQFTLETKAAPAHVKAGDPVTLTATVKGIGSFDRMNAPAIAETPGWRAYPPSGKFAQDDAVGISGAKTFEAALIPESPQTELPPITFSYFNPSSERYETLTGERIPVTVEGNVPPPSLATAAATPAPAQPTPAATPTPAPSDIQYLRTELGSRSVTGFTPVWQTRLFWSVQAAAALAFVGLSGWQIQRARNGNGERQRAARLRRDKEKALAVVRQGSAPASEFFDAAIRVIQIETALARFPAALDPATVDAETAIAVRKLDCETEEGLRRIFAACDELRYAGSGASGLIHPDQAARVRQILEQLEACHV